MFFSPLFLDPLYHLVADFWSVGQIHNPPGPYPHPLSQHPPNPYISSPPAAGAGELSPPPSLTSLLLSSSPAQFTQATQHPFLRLAGQGQLPKAVLSRWLSQDRLYAQSYIGFIGSLIARVDLPYVHVTDADKSSSLRWRIVTLLTSALQNIHRELKFFADTAATHGLDLEAPSRVDGVFTAETATKQYIDLFRAFWTDPSMSLLEGMVVLWATETVYLRAWRYAKSFIAETTPGHQQQQGSRNEVENDANRKSKAFSSTASELEGSEVNASANAPHTAELESPATNAQTPSSQPHSSTRFASDLDSGALRSAFIPNWTSDEFESFVADIAELTDLLAEREDAVARKLDVYKAVWRHILDVETRFWPAVEG